MKASVPKERQPPEALPAIDAEKSASLPSAIIGRLITLEERIRSLWNIVNADHTADSKAQAGLSNALTSSVKTLHERLDLLEPAQLSKTLAHQVRQLATFKSRIDSMVTRYVVISEFIYYTQSKFPTRAVAMVRDLLQYMDESDSVWEGLARRPLGELHTLILSRAAIRTAGKTAPAEESEDAAP